jgi:hypothetical protein
MLQTPRCEGAVRIKEVDSLHLEVSISILLFIHSFPSHENT